MTKSVIRQLLLVALVAALSVALVACGGDDDDTSPTTPSGSSSIVSGGQTDVEAITISMKDNFFEPKAVTIPAGKTVTITVKNEGQVIHNMTVLETEFKSDQLVTAGQESKFEVKFDKAGTYKFQCDYHVPDMVGEITVK